MSVHRYYFKGTNAVHGEEKDGIIWDSNLLTFIDKNGRIEKTYIKNKTA